MPSNLGTAAELASWLFTEAWDEGAAGLPEGSTQVVRSVFDGWEQSFSSTTVGMFVRRDICFKQYIPTRCDRRRSMGLARVSIGIFG